MNIYRVEFISRSNSHFFVETTVKESSIKRAKSYACRWLSYWMGLNAAEFKITIKA